MNACRDLFPHCFNMTSVTVERSPLTVKHDITRMPLYSQRRCAWGIGGGESVRVLAVLVSAEEGLSDPSKFCGKYSIQCESLVQGLHGQKDEVVVKSFGGGTRSTTL
jgi:hypothetical protein